MSALSRFSLPLARPLTTADGPIERREGFIVRVGTTPSGLGEATPLAGWTEGLAECEAALRPAIDESALEAADDLPAMADTPAARHGLELAILDRSARSAREPLYRHLGGTKRISTVPVNAVVGDGTVEETVAAAADATARGFEAVKVKVGARSIDDDGDRLLAVREAVGDAVELRADANGAWSVAQAETLIDRLDGVVDLLEQPLEPAVLDDHRALRDRGPAIALDESIRDHGLDAVLGADAADVVVLKPMALGGVGRATAAATAAREAGLGIIVTTTFDAAVARAAAVHLAAAIDVDRPCGLATASRLADDVATDPVPAVDGAVSVPQSAGHGVTVEDLG